MARALTLYAYKFDELDPKVQAKVIERWRYNDTFFWADEWRDSLKAFADHAPLTIRDWNVGYPGTYVDFIIHEDDNYGDGLGTMSGVRAWKWLMNNGWGDLANPKDTRKSCPFTGYCGDETLLDAIRTALANPATITSLRDVFAECLSDWAEGFEQDYDHWHSEECIREEIEANGYEFYDDGSLV
jgi:hypothetical protein